MPEKKKIRKMWEIFKMKINLLSLKIVKKVGKKRRWIGEKNKIKIFNGVIVIIDILFIYLLFYY